MAVQTYSDEKMLEEAIAYATSVSHIVNKNGLYTAVGVNLPVLRGNLALEIYQNHAARVISDGGVIDESKKHAARS